MFFHIGDPTQGESKQKRSKDSKLIGKILQTLIIDLGEDGCQLIENYVGKCILMEIIPYESDGGKDDGYDDDDR